MADCGGGHFASWFVLSEVNQLGLIVPQGERQGRAGRLDSSGAGHAEGEGRWLSSPRARPMLPSFPLDSGYLFSGSRPPSQVSRSREVPLSGKGNPEPRGVTGRPRRVGAACTPGFPERPCGAEQREVKHELWGQTGQCSDPSPGHVTNTLSLSFSFCEMDVAVSRIRHGAVVQSSEAPTFSFLALLSAEGGTRALDGNWEAKGTWLRFHGPLPSPRRLARCGPLPALTPGLAQPCFPFWGDRLTE